ncbi:MAG TPA: MoxR family ATPase [Candidatus Hydrogenedentes bacterium]|nr:MoxR family ATPase [Candidatus Hydrogenedentota bacterium]
MDVQQTAEQFREEFKQLRAEIAKVIVGAEGIVEGVLTSVFAGGHCLLEGVPGLGKTMLVRTLSEALDLKFSRIQFTPDLMPADIIGTNMIVEDEQGNREFRFRHGPIFGNIILADEINRATPKTQSALLEAMQEHTVSVALTVHRLEEPFFVLATQNPIEMEGTYPLPEAQLDRFFFKSIVDYPSHSELTEIVNRTTHGEMPKGEKVMDGRTINKWQAFVRDVPAAPQVTDYAVRLVLATHPKGELATDMVNRYVRYGSSPRGAQALLLAGKVTALREARFNVSFDDIKHAAPPALRHRILVNFEAEADGVTSDQIVADLLGKVSQAAKVA